jgi:hypothetical protein
MMLVFFGYVAILYWFGLMAWNWRAFQLYRDRVSAPWGEVLAQARTAIRDRDHERFEKLCAESERWDDVANSFPLQDAAFMLNPYRWWMNWNWKPDCAAGRSQAPGA